MAEDHPTQARSSVSNPNKSQTVQNKQVGGSFRSKVVTRPRTHLSLVVLCTPRPFCLPQHGRRTSLPHLQTLIMNSHHRVVHMACPMHVFLTLRRHTPRDRVANIAGSRSLAAFRCSHRNCSALILLPPDSRRGPPSSCHPPPVLPAGRMGV